MLPLVEGYPDPSSAKCPEANVFSSARLGNLSAGIDIMNLAGGELRSRGFDACIRQEAN